MNLVLWMVSGSVLSWFATTAWLGTQTMLEVWLGMIGPLVAAIGTWVLAERIYRRNPERLTSLMVKTFAGKLVFFGGYVAAVLSATPVRPVPFVISFTSYFLALHVAETFGLRRLFAAGTRAPQ